MSPGLQKAASAAERMCRAFIVAFVGVYVMSGLSVKAFTDASLLEKAADAGLAAAGSLILSLIGGNIGNKGTPSLLPAAVDPATVTTAPVPVVQPPTDLVDRHLGLSGPHGVWPVGLPQETPLPEEEQAAVATAPVQGKKLGRRPPKNAPALAFAEHLIATPAFPIADPAPSLAWPMDHNDKAGDCVIAGWDHFQQAVLTLLSGSYTSMSDAAMLALYQTQNPGFRSWDDAGPDDNGMEIQTLLELLAKRGDILGFAKVDHTNLDEVKAATYLGLGIITGETLTTRNMSEQVWDYHSGDKVEGGHCTVTVGYDPLREQVSWGAEYEMTDAFFAKRVEEAWFVILQAHVDHPGFRAGYDMVSFAAAYKQLTGRDFPVPVTPPEPPSPPAPPPSPTPGPDASFLAALDAEYPGMAAWATSRAAHRSKTTGETVTPADYLRWLLAGDAHLRST